MKHTHVYARTHVWAYSTVGAEGEPKRGRTHTHTVIVHMNTDIPLLTPIRMPHEQCSEVHTAAQVGRTVTDACVQGRKAQLAKGTPPHKNAPPPTHTHMPHPLTTVQSELCWGPQW